MEVLDIVHHFPQIRMKVSARSKWDNGATKLRIQVLTPKSLFAPPNLTHHLAPLLQFNASNSEEVREERRKAWPRRKRLFNVDQQALLLVASLLAHSACYLQLVPLRRSPSEGGGEVGRRAKDGWAEGSRTIVIAIGSRRFAPPAARSSHIPPSYMTNKLPLVASLIAVRVQPHFHITSARRLPVLREASSLLHPFSL